MVNKNIIILLSFLYVGNLFSQSNNTEDFNYEVNYITNEEGLSNNKVNAICKDKYGFIWFGTNEGLNRYDGINFTKYQNNKDDTSSISSNLIRTIHKDKDGSLWIGTDDGLNVYNPDIDGFNRISFDHKYSDLNIVWQLFEDKNGVLWIATHHGLYYKEKNGSNIVEFKKFNNLPENSIINSVYIDSRNNLWAGTRKYGLFSYSFVSNESKQFTNVTNDTTSISGNYIYVINEDKKGDLWIGTSNDGLNRYNYETSSFNRIFVYDNFSNKETIKKIVEDKYGRLWIGSSNGLYLRNTETDVFTRFAHTNNTYTNLNHNSIYDLYIDDIDIVWLGTYAGGVNYIDMNQKKFNHFYPKVDDNLFLNSNTIYSIYEDSKNNLWIGTINGGVNYYDRSTNTFTYILNDPDNSNSLSGDNVKAIIEDKSGNIWIGTYKYGLNCYNVKTQEFKHYRADGHNPHSLNNDNIYDLMFDSEDNLWIGTMEGLDLMPKGSDKIIHLGSKGGKKSIFDGDVVSTVFEDSNKNIWVGTYNHGLLLFNKTDSSFTVYNRDVFNTYVYSIAEDNKNQLWIGGSNGLVCINPQNDSIINYTILDGLPATTVFKAFDDDEGNIWISTTSGLSKFINGVNTPNIPIFRNYDSYDGLQNNQFVYNSNDKSSSGEIYFGGINGFNSFFPEEIEDNVNKATVVITGLKIFNREVAIGKEVEGIIVLKKLILNTEELVLSYKHKVITLQFAALHFAQPNKIKYAYRLEGFDQKNSEWNYTDAENCDVTYTNLAGGEYIFKVKASNNDGVWNENPTILKIIVLPPFWKTWWFITLTIFIIFLIAATFYFIRINTLKRQKQVLEQTVNERTADLEQANIRLKELNSTKDKFLSIIAHDIRNPFNAILGFSDLLVRNFDILKDDERRFYAQTISDSSVLVYKLLENLLQWSMAQSKNIKFEPTKFLCSDIFNETVLLLQENINNKKIEVIIDIKEEIEVYADRNMINTVVRNIVSNAIKFSGIEGKIFLSCYKKNDNVEICIRDSGLGMKQEDMQKLFKIDQHFTRAGTIGEIGTGLGLLVCKEFVESHSGEIWIESELGKGSLFFFTIPVHK